MSTFYERERKKKKRNKKKETEATPKPHLPSYDRTEEPKLDWLLT